ncbi:MAG: type II CRISPR-associated endonuclease Cas1 [Planctomycetaceae bacterium]|nr:type II CRISPR-associated endonuclease Cas1 [Planctomycetaceae bacterium]
MRNRIIDISQQSARLSVKHRQLVIRIDESEHKIPLNDLAALIVAHPAVTYTQKVLSEIVAAGGVFITCDEKRMPSGMLLPLDAHSTQTQRFHEQLALSQPRAKRIWQQIVKAKIGMQASLLVIETDSDHGLHAMAQQVKSGDSGNLEAQAAKRYWTALFGSDFRRDRFAADQNSLLNFGYAILRSAIARAICGAGLHPSIGVHHSNKYNSFCLADDLMEPFRPLIDQTVIDITMDLDTVPELDTATRQELLAVFTGDVRLADQTWDFLDAIQKAAGSLGQVICGSQSELTLPIGFAHARV